MSGRQRSEKETLTAESKRFLLVEGADEWRVLRRLQAGEEFVICSANGRDKMLKDAETASRSQYFQQLTGVGLVLDAEGDVAGALDLAHRVITAMNGPPSLEHGVIQTANGKRWGIFLLPDGTTPGALETLIRRDAPPVKGAACADAWEQCVGLASSAAERDKAWLRVASAAWPKVREGWPQMLDQPDGIQTSRLTALQAFVASF